jgi:protein tyrosine phosphatase (PTP) superfamily phosphohydrolase (DUF442 family)
MKKKTKIIIALAAIVLTFTAQHVYQKYFNYNFKEIIENQVYKSGVIPPEKIKNYVEEYQIKTIVDFRHGEIRDGLNPATLNEIEKKKIAVDALEGVNYVHIPSEQVPTEANLENLFKILDNEDSYPVLMHCHHGTGRSMIYSAIYMIEFQGYSNEQARKITRPFYQLPFSSFAKKKRKGTFLVNYKKRNKQGL